MALRVLFFLMLLAFPTLAEDQLADPALENRAQSLFADIRCLTCQAQSIADSEALLAQDLRTLVRVEIAAGKDDDAIRADLRQRYGDKILMSPPLRADTWLLWGGPVLLLLLGLYLARRLVRRA